jgi:hypothetical protein
MNEKQVFDWVVTLYPNSLSGELDEETHRIEGFPRVDGVGFLCGRCLDGGQVAFRQEAIRRWELRPEVDAE